MSHWVLCSKLIIALALLPACGEDTRHTIRLPDRAIPASSHEDDSLRAVVDSLEAELDALQRQGKLPPPFIPFAAQSYSEHTPVTSAQLVGEHLLFGGRLIVEVSRLVVATPDTSPGVRIAFVKVGTDSCGGALFPFGPPEPAVVSVDWAVPGGVAELTGKLTVRLPMPPTDAGTCRLRFYLLDDERVAWAELESLQFLERPSHFRVLPIALYNRRMKLPCAAGAVDMSALRDDR